MEKRRILLKKALFLLFILTLSMNISAEEKTPDVLKGIWEAGDRILFLGENGEISVILKVFDRWYFDRAAESKGFEEKSSRDRNSATSAKPQFIRASFREIKENLFYEMKLYNEAEGKTPVSKRFSKDNDEENLISVIPLCVIDGKIYLEFLVKIHEENETVYNVEGINGKDGEIITDRNSIFGYWQGINCAENIRICPVLHKENIYSYFVLPTSLYRLRFWKTDMDYDENAKAAFTDGENIFTVSKHIVSANSTFTSTSGRSSRIRNVNKFQNLNFDYKTDSTYSVMAVGKECFKKAESADKDRLLEILKEANSRRKPPYPSPFPDEELDFHWDLIDELEKGNKQIQEVRERQKDFGERGKDRGK